MDIAIRCTDSRIVHGISFILLHSKNKGLDPRLLSFKSLFVQNYRVE
jgi:hypothetical protein